MKPLVTVGVALYNHEEFIRQCLQSIIDQDYPSLEIVVIDDGSPDDSFHVAKQVLENQTRREYSIDTRPNRGMCATMNEIIDRSHGGYISFIGSDDYWASDKISDQVAFLEANPQCALVHSNSRIVNARGEQIGECVHRERVNSGRLYEALALGTGGINTSSHLYRTSVYDAIGRYDPQFQYEDTDFWLRLTGRYDVGYIDKFHSCYRIHGANLSRPENNLSFLYDETIEILRKNICEVDLRRRAERRILRKAFYRAFRQWQPRLVMRYFVRYWRRTLRRA